MVDRFCGDGILVDVTDAEVDVDSAAEIIGEVSHHLIDRGGSDGGSAIMGERDIVHRGILPSWVYGAKEKVEPQEPGAYFLILIEAKS